MEWSEFQKLLNTAANDVRDELVKEQCVPVNIGDEKERHIERLENEITKHYIALIQLVHEFFESENGLPFDISRVLFECLIEKIEDLETELRKLKED